MTSQVEFGLASAGATTLRSEKNLRTSALASIVHHQLIRPMRRILSLLALIPGAFVLAYLYCTEGGLPGIKTWIFPTGIVGILLLILGIRSVVFAFKRTASSP